MKNSGTPIGTVMAMACATEPVSTPRRRLALLKAKVAADKSARKPASTRLDLQRPDQEERGARAAAKPQPAENGCDALGERQFAHGISLGQIGAGEGIRTLDPDLGKVVLYP